MTTKINFSYRNNVLSRYINELNFINKSFTYYRDNINGITSKYNKFSCNWWKKRNQAYEYMFFLMKKFNLPIRKGPDYFLTKTINFFI